MRPRQHIQHRGAGDDGETDRGEDGALDARLLRRVRREENHDELQSAEGNVEQGSQIRVVAQAVEDQGSEGVGHGGADVEEQGHPDPEVGLGLERELEDVLPFQVAGPGSGLVCAEALDGLGALVGGEEARGGDGGVEFPIDEGDGDDGYEADEEENAGAGVSWFVRRKGLGWAYICHGAR